MKFKVHRVRFVDYKPQVIHCLAFEDVKSRARLALSRADSSIEIWSLRNDWHQQMIIPGCKGSSVESLVWHSSRLFSAGLHGEVTEWDLARLAPKVSLDSFGGAVWSLAINHAKTHLAAGCEDGCTRLFEITEDGLEYARALDKQEGRILSLSWHASDNFLVTGASDSTVKVYNVGTGHCTLRITMEEFQKRSTLIWNVYITSDFTIITGDSLGNTQFWDGKQGTLLQSYNAHKADVLSMCVNEHEDTVFSSGVDSKVVQFKLITKKSQEKQWIKSSFTRVHSHDVRALALLDAKDMLVSGGVDTKLGVYSLSMFGNLQPKLIPPFPHTQHISLASKANIIMYQQPSSLQFWRLGETVAESTVVKRPPAQLLQISAKGDNHIMCSAIAPCSKWVAFSDIHHISLFRINLDAAKASKFKITRVLPLPPGIQPAQRMVFTQDSSKLVYATNEHSIQILELGDELELSTTFSVPGEENDLPAMCLLAVSENSRWVACVDSRNAVNVFDLKHSKHHCTLPTFSSDVTAVAFQPKTQNLALVCAGHQIYIYSTKSTKLTDWCKQAASKGLPTQWISRCHKVIGITFSPSSPDVMVLQDHAIFTVIDLREPLPDPDVVLFEKKTFEDRKRKGSEENKQDWRARKKRKEQDEKGATGITKEKVEGATPTTEGQNAFKVCKKYQPLLFTGFCEDESMVVVERPWLHVLETLPPTLYRKRYGR